VIWSLVTSDAPWAARYGHTTVIDAAGTMYLIGGYNGTSLNDVWSSANKGANRTIANRTIAQGVLKGHSRGYYSDTLEVLTVYGIYIDIDIDILSIYLYTSISVSSNIYIQIDIYIDRKKDTQTHKGVI
jgi:hypothetical protein